MRDYDVVRIDSDYDSTVEATYDDRAAAVADAVQRCESDILHRYEVWRVVAATPMPVHEVIWREGYCVHD